MAFNLFETPKLTKPIQAYDPTRSVQENMNGQSQPSAQNINAAYQTPQAQLQLRQGQQQAPPIKPTPVVDPTSPTSGMDAVIANMYTSPEQEEKMRRASVANQRILAIGDALRHIGNIYHTVNYAPSQQFNSPVQEEYDRYQKGKAVRDAANARYLGYQQAKAAQDAKAKQWEMQFKLGAANAASQAAYREEQARIAAANAASQDAYRRGNLARQAAADKARNELGERRLKQQARHQDRMAGIASMNAQNNKRRTDAYVEKLRNGGGKGSSSGVAPLDTPKGRITPNGRSYSNQLLQMFDYAKSKGYVQESDVARRLREMGFGKDQSDNVKRQMVMDLLRSNQDMGDYAANRLGWSYGGGNMDLGLEDDEDGMDLGLE